MQVLTISDEVKRELYSGTTKERFQDVRLILSCGDLRPSYLEFIVSTLNVPLLYVPGNHDAQPELTAAGQSVSEPLGCIKVDGRFVHESGFAIAGLGGSPWYNGEKFQYSESHMRLRVLLLTARVLFWQRRTGRTLDFMLTHAAPRGIHDGPGAHRGFECFRWFLERVQPRYFIHGHVHPRYGYNKVTESTIGRTTVINTVGYRLLEVSPYDDAQVQAQG